MNRWKPERGLLGATAAVAAGVTGGVVLTDGARESGDLSAFDPGVTTDFISARSDIDTVVAHVFTFLGSTTALLPLTVALLVLLCVRRRLRAAGAVALGMSMSLALTVLLKDTIQRLRPPSADMLGVIETGFAFPSGHTLNGSVFYGLVTGLLLTVCSATWARVAVVAGGVSMALGIGLSRVYRGFHWLTDVMAGWSIAAAVLGAVVLIVMLFDSFRSSVARS